MSVSAACAEMTKKGRPCRRRVAEGESMCPVHLGVAVKPAGPSPEVAKAIVDELAAGNFIETALAVADVPRATFYDWLDRGVREPDGDFGVFRAQVQKARAEAESRNVRLIAAAGRTSWQAAAWLLERQHPERWGKPGQRAAKQVIAIAPDASIQQEEIPSASDDTPAAGAPADPFAEADELAERRRLRVS